MTAPTEASRPSFDAGLTAMAAWLATFWEAAMRAFREFADVDLQAGDQ